VANHIDVEQKLLGGPGIVCQIDESCFSHHAKTYMEQDPQDLYVYLVSQIHLKLASDYMFRL
ncbi:hypothetical protein H311_00212, partial [Anncaliia algerae PRA109]